MNYARPAFTPVPKGTPKVVQKIVATRKAASLDRREKEAVRKRDREACRVCGRKSREVHERLFKSRGGVASLSNSLVLCRVCHGLAQGHGGLKVYGPSCDGLLSFGLSPEAAKLVFRGRALPSHVTEER